MHRFKLVSRRSYCHGEATDGAEVQMLLAPKEARASLFYLPTDAGVTESYGDTMRKRFGRLG